MDWILFLILSLISIFVAGFLVAKNDYFGFFTAGLFLIISGIVAKKSELIYLGAIYAIISVFNMEKWQRPKDWSQMSKAERKSKMIIFFIVLLFFLLMMLISIK